MIRWFTAIIFSILVHLGIILGYSAFTSDNERPPTRKITNVNFLETEEQKLVETKQPKKNKPKKQNNENISEPKIETKKETKKEIKNLDQYLKDEELQKENSSKLDIVEQISLKVIKDIENLWVRPNNVSKGMFVDFTLKLNRVGLIESIEMKRTSGDKTFDRAALTAIRKYKQINYIKNIDDETFQSYFANFTLRFKPE
tara:strand:+ start:58 stop:657 length:600 start_codon:yes stop_codon:yes gene_type:complete